MAEICARSAVNTDATARGSIWLPANSRNVHPAQAIEPIPASPTEIRAALDLSLIHISEPTRLALI
eukprot:15185343-Alexandrium_andersonii.AAC.1